MQLYTVIAASEPAAVKEGNAALRAGHVIAFPW